MNREATNNDPVSTVRVKQAAAMLSVSPRTVWRMIADGQLKAIRFRRCTRLLADDVAKFLSNSVKMGSI